MTTRDNAATAGPLMTDNRADFVVELLRCFRKDALLVAVLAVMSAALGVGLAYSLPERFVATTLVAPASNDAMGGLTAFGGLGAIGGVLSGGLGGDNSTAESLATLQSRQLFNHFAAEVGILDELTADSETEGERGWLPWTSSDEISLWNAYGFFNENVMTVSQNRVTGLVTIDIEWSDPAIAAKWANDIVSLTNTYLRDTAEREASRRIDYLYAELDKTQLVELRSNIHELIKGQVEAIMQIRGQPEYAFKVIDPAVQPERPSKPRKLLIVAISLMLGFAMILFLTVIRHRTKLFT